MDNNILMKAFQEEYRKKIEQKRKVFWDVRKPLTSVTLEQALLDLTLENREKIGLWQSRRSSNLGLFGSVGIGKTELAVLLAEQYSIEHSVVPMFVKYQELFVLRLGKTEEDALTWKRLLSADIVVVDDIMASDSTALTDWKHDTLYEIFDTRYVRNLPTIFTSNLLAEPFKNLLGARIVDRIKNDLVSVTITGESRRGNK